VTTPQSPLSGGFNLNDWLGQLTNLATLEDILRTLQPVQELREFQRRIRNVQLNTSPTIGQFTTFSKTVPENEAWRLLWVGYTQLDTGTDHVVQVRIIPRIPVDSPIPIFRGGVAAALDACLYPSHRGFGSSSGVFFADSGPPFELFPGDQLNVFDETAVVGAASTATLRLRYELIPIPVTQEVDTGFGSSVF